jgi:hypothetical protein
VTADNSGKDSKLPSFGTNSDKAFAFYFNSCRISSVRSSSSSSVATATGESLVATSGLKSIRLIKELTGLVASVLRKFAFRHLLGPFVG